MISKVSRDRKWFAIILLELSIFCIAVFLLADKLLHWPRLMTAWILGVTVFVMGTALVTAYKGRRSIEAGNPSQEVVRETIRITLNRIFWILGFSASSLILYGMVNQGPSPSRVAFHLMAFLTLWLSLFLAKVILNKISRTFF